MCAAGHESPADVIGKHEAISTRKVLLAVLSGIMLTASFPPEDVPFLPGLL